MPADLGHLPLGMAIVELVLRQKHERSWTSWRTVAGAFAKVMAALRLLPLYVQAKAAIDLRQDTVFMSAYKRSLHLARISSITRSAKPPLPFDEYGRIKKKIASPSALLLFRTMWAVLGRASDTRQIQPDDLRVQRRTKDGSTSYRVQATFRYGKGAAFWGPYTVVVGVSEDLATRLAAFVEQRRRADRNASLWSAADQAVVASVLKQHEFDLRGIRKGAIQELARRGVPDSAIIVLSGHKRISTLRQFYLGLGVLSADNRVTDSIVSGAGPKLGPFLGTCGDQGRRISSPPPMVPRSAPSHGDLGLPVPDQKSWPLANKDVGTFSVPCKRLTPLC
jgi:hypothetical protein